MFKFTYPTKGELISTLLQTKKDYNLTNEGIAKAIGVSTVTMSNWLNLKSFPTDKYQNDIEDFIAHTWQPGIVCVWNDSWKRKGQFFLVGSIYDPFFTWIHNYGPTEEEYKADIQFIEDMERQVNNGEATLHIVKKYIDMDEANTLGRDEEKQYNFGAMGNPECVIHFIRAYGQIETKPVLTYEPKH